jgi:sugar/nucleoside kinase (ribokinase family)
MQRNIEKKEKLRVLGVGLAIIDYIATVDHFPEPDEKMRSQVLECVGGGNCYNALSTLSSMGVVTKIVSKIGADPHGKKVIELCRQNNIDTQHLVSEEKMNTAFSFM